MKRNQVWLASSVAVSLLIVAGGWFFLVAPKKADAQASLDAAASSSNSLARVQSQLTELTEQAKQIPALNAQIAAVQTKIPAQASQAELILAITDAAATARVTLLSIAPGTAQPVASLVAGAAAAPGTAPAAANTAGATTLGATAGPKPTEQGSIQANGQQANGQQGSIQANGQQGSGQQGSASGYSAGSTGLMALPISLQIKGGFVQSTRFFNALEKLQRVVLVTGFDMAADTSLSQNTDRMITSNLQIRGFYAADITGLGATSGSSGATGPTVGSGASGTRG